MSDSRLEKFIYAICSMDVTDLPVPLSRIEKLWNCLITGETPDFEPLSRNEKYLMAMLDRYDISNLPAPMSRGEKLLYKIAVGETDLSDVPGYLSRYEELLKYLIENGGIGFEYVLYTINQSLYTLYTTAEKPVKSAILKGQTLVNINSYYNSSDFINSHLTSLSSDGFITLEANGSWRNVFTRKTSLVKPNTKYLVVYEIKENTLEKFFIMSQHDTESVFSSYQTIVEPNFTGILKYVATTNNDISSSNILLRDFISTSTTQGKIVYRTMVIEYVDGMENWDIPFFRGMQSVKMPVLTTTGKNLFNKDDIIVDGYIISNGSLVYQENDNRNATNFIEVMPNTTYMLSGIKNSAINAQNTHMYVGAYDENKDFIKSFAIVCNNDYTTITTEANTKYIRFTVRNEDVNRLQLEQGALRTSYEPFKSNILTVNEDVTLRSNGNICDELNLLTGQLTQRIDEDGEVLSQEVIKTVDLTVIDQDNQPTKLGTFENVTHVSLKSAGLIQEVEMEVATRISEELASASPLMDDISNNQQRLESTVNEQSNNVDATMIATTEIYEETL